jgi:hypothetical protein
MEDRKYFTCPICNGHIGKNQDHTKCNEFRATYRKSKPPKKLNEKQVKALSKLIINSDKRGAKRNDY